MEYLIGIMIVVLYWIFASITFKYIFKGEYLKVKQNIFNLDVFGFFIISLLFWWAIIPVVLLGSLLELFFREVIIKESVDLFDDLLKVCNRIITLFRR